MDEIYEFLINAKKGTYANGDVSKMSSSRVGSNDYEYSDGKFVYHDTYFGGTCFMGEEVVYSDSIPIWGMNYYGVTLDESLSEEAVDMVLRPALMLVGTDNILPVRGPREFINGDFKYNFDVDGDLNFFNGIETVYKNDSKVYVLKCHGGRIVR